MTKLSLYPIGGSYLLVACVALVLLGLLYFRPRWKAAGPGGGVALVVLRAAIIVLLVLAMLRPTLVYTTTTKQQATLLLLADQSRSMSVPDAMGGKTRWEVLRRTVADAAPALAELAEDFELKAYTFDAKAQTAKVTDGKIALPNDPLGKQTAIGASLEDVLQREAGKRLLGVILLSDGSQRAYAPRDMPPQTAAARLKNLGYPLFTVPLGQSQGLGQAKDVAAADLLVNQYVFVKNQLAISGQVRVDGFVNREIPVRVLFETSPGKMETVAYTKLKATSSGQLLPVDFSYAPQKTGEFKLTLEATEQPGELVTTNNRLSTFVNVLGGGLNVLYIEGSLRVEQKFIRRALDASPEINVDYLRIDPRRPETRPTDMAELFKPGKYDVYMLGDLDVKAFDGNELRDLAETVGNGAGLIMLGGFHSFGPGGYAKSPLADVLPIRMDANERQSFEGKPREDVHLRPPGPVQMTPTQLGARHFALTLSGSRAGNTAAWAKLPPLDGANRFAYTRLKPAALVLAEVAGRNAPLLVAHNFGDGRVMAFAGDSTWHWPMRGFDSAHKRFWRQIVLWLARKDQSMDGRVWVKLEKRRFAPGEQIELTAGAEAPGGEPLEGAKFKASVVMPDGTRQDLRLFRRDLRMAGTFRETTTAGDYTIEVEATDKDGEPVGSTKARFLVFEQDLELDNAAADAASLKSLAAMTGGKSLAPEQLSELIEQLALDTEDLEIQRETKTTFWDSWSFFLLLVGLLGIEWYLRKRWGLV